MSADGRDLSFIVLRLPEGKYIFQRRSNDMKRSPGKLCFFGGGIEKDETPFEAATRELREETSISFMPEDLKEILSFPRTHNQKIAHLFILNIESNNFEVFEGAGAEAHYLTDLINSDEVTRLTKIGCIYLLERVEED